MLLRSLRHRLVLFTLTIVAIVILASDIAMSLTLREELQGSMARALAARVALVEELDGIPGSELHEVLLRRSVPAVIDTPQGERLVSRPEVVADPGMSEVVELEDGSRVEVLVRATGGDGALQRVRFAILAGSLVAVLTALVLLGVFAHRVLRPLDDMVETARAITRGRTGARLGPGDPRTEIGRLASAFDEMLDAQERALQTAREAEVRSRRFLADAAHQLRTPVAGLRAASEALLHSPSPAEQDTLVGNLARESARTGRLLDALLRMAHLDRGEDPPRLDTDLVPLLSEEIERQRGLAPSLAIDLHAPDTLVVPLDANGLRESVANLLDNARRHARATIEVELRPSPDGARLRIRDDGPGLEPGTEEAVFDRFVSLDDRGGSGLGLAIARAYARAHDGDVVWRDGAFELTVRAPA
ncbi:HAMP domain-containing sensor histidine kinase [Egicoccus halophilus]|uniref:histidine kinase n=1 Tax=Egicoccus halophilus TaxID=1670830 RepID=A0A8J3A934_9ACTN|nr:HAMP domain-containing sensor histidine kinase [Egicoccus halophilus]GGI05013.1 two-component sensor histidine kinase [Egicoccus halophilus]